jgi:hypothetical protein
MKISLGLGPGHEKVARFEPCWVPQFVVNDRHSSLELVKECVYIILELFFST